jgi:hypothetical protein
MLAEIDMVGTSRARDDGTLRNSYALANGDGTPIARRAPNIARPDGLRRPPVRCQVMAARPKRFGASNEKLLLALDCASRIDDELQSEFSALSLRAPQLGRWDPCSNVTSPCCDEAGFPGGEVTV